MILAYVLPDHRFECPVGSFHRVTVRRSYWGGPMFNPKSFKKVLQLPRPQLSTVVRDDLVGASMPVDDLLGDGFCNCRGGGSS